MRRGGADSRSRGVVRAGINPWAILVAAVGGWLVGGAWYAAFGQAWLTALGKSKEELRGSSGTPSWMPFLVAFVCLLVMAAVLASFIALRAPPTVSNGILVGFLAWLGFVVTSKTVNHRFTSQWLSLPAIDSGHWLLVLLLQGAMIGGVRGLSSPTFVRRPKSDGATLAVPPLHCLNLP